MLALACGGVKYRKKETNEKVTVEQGTAKILNGSLWTKSLIKFFSRENSSRVVWTLASPEDIREL